MSTQATTFRPAGVADAALHGADTAIVLEHLLSGTPLDPEVVDRVRARAEQVTAEIQRNHGLVDDDVFQSLLDDEA